MTCCLMALSHYLNQCWPIIKGVLWYSPESNFTVTAHAAVLHLKIILFKIIATRMSLTHWVRDKMAAIFQTTFSNAFCWMKMYEFRLKISLKFVPQGPINNIPALVQIMAWRRPGDKPLSGPMMVKLPTHICVTRPQWVKVIASNAAATLVKAGRGIFPVFLGSATDNVHPGIEFLINKLILDEKKSKSIYTKNVLINCPQLKMVLFLKLFVS